MSRAVSVAELPLVRSGTPGGSRTPNLLVRSQALYPIELRVQTVCQSIEQARMSKLKANQLNQTT